MKNWKSGKDDWADKVLVVFCKTIFVGFAIGAVVLFAALFVGGGK